MAVTAAALSLAKSVVELVTEIFKARAAGIKKGDPLVLIVRRVYEKNEYREAVILRIGQSDAVDSGVIEKELNTAIQETLKRREQ